ncbi:MAG TPA: transketolase C-terminal domain-containing protein [Candidatus Paceibacterota bacterium]|nr:transketolase C-terminal domain-containing protein [Candidatus Paceibacterota bacterium]
MINPDAHLREDWEQPAEEAATRDGFGTGVLDAGKDDERVMVVCADLTESTRTDKFKEAYPDRFIEAGITEQHMAGLGSGLAAAGKVPFIASYAAFNPGRNYEQVRTTIALNQQPVIIAGCHAGVSVGPDGATHQMLEDIGLMRMLPNMTVVAPADAEEARKATLAAAAFGKPIYLRFGREKTPVFTTPETPFEIGKAITLWDDAAPQVAIITTGALAHHALRAASELEESGIRSLVLNNHTIKPMDEAAVLAAAKKAGAVVTVEEHQIMGGMGSAVAELLAREHPVPVEFVGVHDVFGQSGKPDELIAHYGMDTPHIVTAARKVIVRK